MWESKENNTKNRLMGGTGDKNDGTNSRPQEESQLLLQGDIQNFSYGLGYLMKPCQIFMIFTFLLNYTVCTEKWKIQKPKKSKTRSNWPCDSGLSPSSPLPLLHLSDLIFSIPLYLYKNILNIISSGTRLKPEPNPWTVLLGELFPKLLCICRPRS